MSGCELVALKICRGSLFHRIRLLNHPRNKPPSPLSRRDLFRGFVVLATYSPAARPLRAFGLDPVPEDSVIPFQDPQPFDPKRPMLRWSNLTDWITRTEDLYEVSHYPRRNIDTGLRPGGRTVNFGGFLNKPREVTLAEIMRRPRRTITATLDCGGHGSNPGFSGACGNVRWTGTPLGPLLQELVW